MRQEGFLWYDNREKRAGFPSECVGFEFKEKKKEFQVKTKGDKEAH